MSWATHYVGDLRGINNELLDTYQLKSLDALLGRYLCYMLLISDYIPTLIDALDDTIFIYRDLGTVKMGVDQLTK